MHICRSDCSLSHCSLQVDLLLLLIKVIYLFQTKSSDCDERTVIARERFPSHSFVTTSHSALPDKLCLYICRFRFYEKQRNHGLLITRCHRLSLGKPCVRCLAEEFIPCSRSNMYLMNESNDAAETN